MKKTYFKGNLCRKAFCMIVFLFIFLSSITISIGSVATVPENVRKSSEINFRSTTVLLEEGFEDGIMPPTDWSIEIENPDFTWMVVDDPVYNGSFAAKCPGANPPDQDEWLITPSLDLTGYDEVILTFWINSIAFGSDWTVELQVNDDILWDMVNEESWSSYEYRLKTVDLSSYIGDTVTIAWRYVGTRGFDAALDDVCVLGEIYAPTPALNIENVTGGGGLLSGGVVSAELLSNGEADAEDIEWTITVTGGFLNRINVTTTDTIDSLATGSMIVITNENPIYGLGPVDITVTATAPNTTLVRERAEGFVFLFYLIIR